MDDSASHVNQRRRLGPVSFGRQAGVLDLRVFGKLVGILVEAIGRRAPLVKDGVMRPSPIWFRTTPPEFTSFGGDVLPSIVLQGAATAAPDEQNRLALFIVEGRSSTRGADLVGSDDP